MKLSVIGHCTKSWQMKACFINLKLYARHLQTFSFFFHFRTFVSCFIILSLQDFSWSSEVFEKLFEWKLEYFSCCCLFRNKFTHRFTWIIFLSSEIQHSPRENEFSGPRLWQIFLVKFCIYVNVYFLTSWLLNLVSLRSISYAFEIFW